MHILLSYFERVNGEKVGRGVGGRGIYGIEKSLREGGKQQWIRDRYGRKQHEEKEQGTYLPMGAF
jgi:hypothetical protein